MSTVAFAPPKIATLAFYPQQRPGFRLYALWHFSTFMILWHLFGQTYLGFEQAWAHPLITISTACLTQFFLEWVDAKANKRTPRYAGGIANFLNFFPPAIIVGGALGMLLYPNELMAPAIFAAVISIASKVLIRVRLPNGQKHHVFNPSNLGIVATLLLFPDVVGMAPPYHFTENLTGAWHWALPAIILSSGLFLHYNATGRLPLCLTWLTAFASQAIFRAWMDGSEWYVHMMPMSSAAFIVFTLYMIPDPATTPLVRWRQVLFAASVAFVYLILLSQHHVFGLFISLFTVCAIRGLSIEFYTLFLQRKAASASGEMAADKMGNVAALVRTPDSSGGSSDASLPATPRVERKPNRFRRLKIPAAMVCVLGLITFLHLWLNVGFASLFASHAEPKFRVGFLPVTCHLTCPVTDWINTNMVGEGIYQPRKFNAWPEIKESLLSGELPCSFLLAPLAMKLVEDGAPLKIVYLGHRDGTAIVVHVDSDIHSIEDLKGKTIAVPNRFSNQYLIFFKALKDRGMSISDVIIKELPPPDMPAALAAKQVDAITSGEPFMGQAELQGYGRVLYQARELWPNFISCVLVVRDEMIRDHPDKVQILVDGIAKSGKWLDVGVEHRLAAAEAVAKNYYHQDPALLRFVLTKTPDRVTYTKLMLAKDDFDQIMNFALEAGILKHPLKFEQYTDTQFSEKTQDATAQKMGAVVMKNRVESIVLPLIVVAVLIAVWHVLVKTSGSNIFPTPGQVALGIVELAQKGVLHKYVIASLFRVFWGFGLAMIVGVPMGLLMGWYGTAFRAFNPLIQVLRPISPIAWIPVAILWFGIDDRSPIFLIFLASVFPICTATVAAVRNIPIVYLRAAQNFGVSGPAMFARILFPGALPQIITGLRIALGVAWLVVVAAEMIAVDSGLGYLIIDARNAGKRYDLVVAGMVLIGLIGLILDLAVRRLERLDEVRWGFPR